MGIGGIEDKLGITGLLLEMGERGGEMGGDYDYRILTKEGY